MPAAAAEACRKEQHTRTHCRAARRMRIIAAAARANRQAGGRPTEPSPDLFYCSLLTACCVPGCVQVVSLHAEQRHVETVRIKQRARPSPRRLGGLIGGRRRPRGGLCSASAFLAQTLDAAVRGHVRSCILKPSDDVCVLRKRPHGSREHRMGAW